MPCIDRAAIERIRERRVEMQKHFPGAIEMPSAAAHAIEVLERSPTTELVVRAQVRRAEIVVPVIPVPRDGQRAREAFQRQVGALPADIRARVSDVRSYSTPEGLTTFCDDEGEILWRHPELDPVPKRAPARRAAPTPIPAVQAAGVSHSELEMFGAAVGKTIADAVRQLKKRIADLEEQTAGMQGKLDRGDRKSLGFAGAWQQVLDYESGEVVADNGKLFVAAKKISAGGSLRDGSGWIRMI